MEASSGHSQLLESFPLDNMSFLTPHRTRTSSEQSVKKPAHLAQGVKTLSVEDVE
jgi:hypothetical protein